MLKKERVNKQKNAYIGERNKLFFFNFQAKASSNFHLPFNKRSNTSSEALSKFSPHDKKIFASIFTKVVVLNLENNAIINEGGNENYFLIRLLHALQNKENK